MRIIDAATELLADRGYGGCSIAAVSTRAGVSAGTVYNHFAGKSELVAEVFRTVVGREVAAVRSAVRPTDPVVERTVALVETFAGRALKSPRLAYALLAEPVDPVVDALRLQFRVAFRDIAAESIALGVERGELPPQDTAVVSAALVGAIGEALVGPLAGELEPGTVPALIDFALRSLGLSPTRGVSDAPHA
ncbi:MAG: putative transcriptional regulator, ArcR family [Jatrophihabitans sp.]|nr:putative transcriptional regulator, ArcR family [Jatrophihabitans sp.]